VEDGDVGPARGAEDARDVGNRAVAADGLGQGAELAALPHDALLALHHEERGAPRVEEGFQVDGHGRAQPTA
jgi:hypothetical protein